MPRWPSDWLGLSPEASHTARVAGSHLTNGFVFSNTVEVGTFDAARAGGIRLKTSVLAAGPIPAGCPCSLRCTVARHARSNTSGLHAVLIHLAVDRHNGDQRIRPRLRASRA
ncbi:hypothetical protein BRN69_09335 [Xanthomonas oryzae pv. oryzae]|nr:hypothetical protein BRN69_09335 [Xanthomonas oryzae pv. oryzae]